MQVMQTDGIFDVAIKLAEADSMDEEIAKSPGTVIQKAKRGSLSACVALQDAAERDLPDPLFHELLNVFATHVQNSCPPEKADRLAFQLADICFPGLLMMLNSPKFQVETHLQILLKVWPFILKWERSSLIEAIRSDERIDFRPERKWCEARVLLSAVCKFWRTEEFRTVAWGVQLLELVRYAYLHPNPDEDAIKVLCVTTFFVHFEVKELNSISTLISMMEDKSVLYLDFLLILVDDVKLARLPSHMLGPCSRAFLGFAFTKDCHITSTMIEKGSTFVKKALGTLIDQKQKPEVHASFPFVMKLLSICSQDPGGARWPLAALQNGVLEVVAIFPDEDLVKFKREFISLLPIHLIDPCIIYACEGAISMLSVDDHRKLLNGPLGKEWKSFIDQFFEKYMFYCYFEYAGYPKGCYRCGKHVETGAKLRKCTACKRVEYCSEKCQTEDWPSHRKNCKALKDKKYCPFPSYAIDLFRRRLAAYDVRRHLPGLRKLASKRFPGFPLRSLCIEVDYSNYPPKISVISTAELDKLQDVFKQQELTDVPAVLDDIRLHNGSMGVILIREKTNGMPVVRKHEFDWSPPYFSSEHGSCARQNYRGTSLSTPYRDDQGNKLETTWSEVDELAARGGLESWKE